MFGELIPYQIGDPRDGCHHVFTRADMESDMSIPIKTNIANYPIGHGNVDLALDRPDYLDDWIVDIDFMLFDKEAAACLGIDYNNQDICKVRQILHSYPCKVFPIFFKKMGLDGEFTWLVTYAHPTADGMPSQQSSQRDSGGNKLDRYNMRLRLVRPYLYAICDDDIRCATTTDWLNTEFALDPDDCLDPGECMLSHYDLTTPMSELTKEELDAFCACDGTGKCVVWFDRFFKKEICGINKDSDFEDYTITTGDNTDTQVELITNFDFGGNGFNYNYQIQFDALEAGEWIFICNGESEIKFEWVGSSANPNPIIYNSFDSTFYDSATCKKITDIKYSTLNQNASLLYFGNAGNKNIEKLKLRKEADSDIDLTIKFYKTYLT